MTKIAIALHHFAHRVAARGRERARGEHEDEALILADIAEAAHQTAAEFETADRASPTVQAAGSPEGGARTKSDAAPAAGTTSPAPPLLPLEAWHEGVGDVLWWKFPIVEPPYVGSPLDLGQTVEITVRAHGVDKLMRAKVGGWPGYHTHWTPIVRPAEPT